MANAMNWGDLPNPSPRTATVAVNLGLNPRLAYPNALYDTIQNKTANFDLFV